MMESLKLLAVFAHPDDESMGMGGTLAKYAAEGVETYLICASRGERGWFGPEEQNPGWRNLGATRTLELQNAATTLGIKQLVFLGYMDGEVDQAPYTEAVRKIVTHLRRIKPQVVVSFPPDGNYGHPDHIAMSQFTSAAIVCAADANYPDEENNPPYRVSKFYYMVDAENFINLIAPFMETMSFYVDEQLRGEFPWKDWMVTTRIEMADYCPTAWNAIQCHQSQLSTLGALAEMPKDSAASVLAMQGTFYRVFSLVNGGRTIETDLFAGLRN